MATMMIVHGGWGGGWEWTPVSEQLRERGHQVFAPTLTGLGERAHLGEGVGLSSHIDDVLAVFEFEELRDVVLCGHSYSGMVITGAADRIPERIRGLVYLDAFVPNDGQALRDLVPDEFADGLLNAAKERGDGKIPYPPELFPPEGLIPEDVRAGYIGRTRPQPAATFTEAVRLTGAASALPRAYVRCTGDPDSDGGLTATAPFAARARTEGWPYRELATAHDLHLFDPAGTVSVLDGLAKSFD